MNETDLPALPPAGAIGPEVCGVMRLYLAVSRDLSPDQVRAVAAHVKTCANCSREHRMVSQATQLIESMEESTPSARVDQAVLAAIAARTGAANGRAPIPLRSALQRKRRRSVVSARVVSAVAAVAAVLVLAVMATMHFIPLGAGSQALALPASVSWNGYVLHHVETKMSSSGQEYQIVTYRDMSSGRVKVETTAMGNEKKLDVMLVGDDKKVLVMDMNKRVAQWGANEWNVDDSMFDLDQLRDDLKANRATYLGEGTFNGQPVYRIKDDNGLVLLLNKEYKPVNVLKDANASGAGKPVYEMLELVPASQVSSATWEMEMPDGFQMGTLPKKPV